MQNLFEMLGFLGLLAGVVFIVIGTCSGISHVPFWLRMLIIGTFLVVAGMLLKGNR